MTLRVVRRVVCALVFIAAAVSVPTAHADPLDYYPPNPNHQHVDVGGVGFFPLPGLLIHGSATIRVEGGVNLQIEPPKINGSQDSGIRMQVKSSFVGVATVYVTLANGDGSTSFTYKLVLFIGFPHCANPVEVCPTSGEIPATGVDLTMPVSTATVLLLMGAALVRTGRRSADQTVELSSR